MVKLSLFLFLVGGICYSIAVQEPEGAIICVLAVGFLGVIEAIEKSNKEK